MRRLRVLVVEDDAMIGSLLGEILGGLGHEVCAIEFTRAGAVAAATLHHPDIMIVDAKLGIESGVGAVEDILATRNVPYVLTSGADISVHRKNAVVLLKPYREPQIVDAIKLALRGAEAGFAIV